MSDRERQIEESWTANAGAWSNVIQNQLLESRRLVTNDAILETVRALRAKRVLDVGCGEGWLAHRLADEGITVVGFDGSSELIAHASARPGTFQVLSYTDFNRSPEDVGSEFDVAICNFSLLGRDIGPVIAACRRVLRPGGFIAIQTVHPFADATTGSYEDGWREETFDQMPVKFAEPMPWYFRSVQTWVREVQDAQFELTGLHETTHPVSGRPLSLILIGRAKIS